MTRCRDDRVERLGAGSPRRVLEGGAGGAGGEYRAGLGRGEAGRERRAVGASSREGHGTCPLTGWDTPLDWVGHAP